MNPIQNAILERRSTRGFDATALTKDEIGTLVDAALASPSAMNKQPWRFAFVTDRALLKEFSEAFRAGALQRASEPMRARFADPAFDLFMGAPLFVVISYDPIEEHPFTGVDCGIAVQNLALSALGMGLGSVIVGMPRDVFVSDMGDYFRGRMGVPAGNAFSIGIVIGHNTVTKDAHPIGEGKVSIV